MTRQRFDRQRDRGEGRTGFVPKPKVCPFCANKDEVIDYKDSVKLNRYVSSRGKIGTRRRTGACAKHQRLLAVAIKRARHLALLPYAPAHMPKTGEAGIGD